MIRHFAIACSVAVMCVAGDATAQSASVLYSRGVTAYRALEYDSATALLSRALSAREDSLEGRTRALAHVYLGAAHQLRGASAAARAAFMQALAVDPRHRIDELIFPPDVTRVFEDTRLATAYTSFRSPGDTVIVAGSQSLTLRLYASAPHEAEVLLQPRSGGTMRLLWSGEIRDSVDIDWDGLDANGEQPMVGALVLRSRPASRTPHSAEGIVPLQVTALPVDTAVHPVQPAAPRVIASSAPSPKSIRALAVGTVAGVAAVFLPQIVGKSGSAMPERFAVGATLSAAGIAGFLLGQRDEQRNRESAAAASHERALESWRAEVERVQAANARLLRTPRLRVQIQPPSRGGS